MRVVVFGSTGGTGKQLLERGLKRAHDMVAVARKPSAVPQRNRLTILKGDVLDADSVAAAVRGAHAVICAFGPADELNPGTLMSEGMQNIVTACEAAGVRRVVFESGLMAGWGNGLALHHRAAVLVFGMTRMALRNDKRKAEATLMGSRLDWIIVRPPGLGDVKPKGKYVCGVNARVNPTKKMAYADVADCLLDVTASSAHSRVVLSVGH